MKRCGKCGARNLDEEKSCTLCGNAFGSSWTPRTGGGVDPNAAESFEPRLMQKGGNKPPVHRGEIIREGAGREGAAAPVVPPSTPPREDLRAERHYLVLTFGDPLKLDPKVASLVLGRDLDCQVKVPSLKASRRHAELRWKDGRVVIRDLGSRNGTWVDGSKIDKQAVLEDGQDVRLGDSILTYRLLVPGEELRVQQGPADTIIDEPVAAAPAASGGPVKGLEGELVFMPVGELLKRLIAIRATGTIAVHTAGSEGRVDVRNGVAADAAYAALEGPVALQALASLTRGTFRWTPDTSWKAPVSGVFQAPPLG